MAKVLGFVSESDTILVITEVDGGRRFKVVFETYDGQPMGLTQFNPTMTSDWKNDARQYIERMGGVEVLSDRIFLENLPGSYVRWTDLVATFWGTEEELTVWLNGAMSFGINPQVWMGMNDEDTEYRGQPVVWDGCFEFTEHGQTIFSGSTAPCGDGERAFRLVNKYDLIYVC